MLLKEKDIEVKINHRNRKYYGVICNKELKNGDSLIVRQGDVQKTSRILVICECDFCLESFPKKMVDIVGNKTFCSKKCRNENLKLNNPNPSKDKVKVPCSVCNEDVFIDEAKSKKQQHFLCSRDCYKIHRSIVYKGDKLYNYQNLKVECENCNKKFKVSQFDIDSRNHLFCSQECYWKHRKDNYTNIYYSSSLNDSRKETKPEIMVREWLEQNNITYVQEFGFMRKYYIDFYLPKYKSFIEVFGDYWHVNPELFGDGEKLKPLTDQQKGKRESDIERIHEIESHGYKVYVIWENEVHTNIDLYMGKIIDNFNKNPQRLHAKPL
jgi:G:T-mismatch repair DNA endonuclease (very short patch repair protein)